MQRFPRACRASSSNTATTSSTITLAFPPATFSIIGAIRGWGEEEEDLFERCFAGDARDIDPGVPRRPGGGGGEGQERVAASADAPVAVRSC